MRYITLPLRVDPITLIRNAQLFIQSKFPNWRAADGNLDTWMIEAVSAPAADLYFLASAVPDTIFRYFGNSLMDLPPVDASAAITTTTWVAVDDNGYVIPAGTQVGIVNQVGETIPFLTLNEVVIAPGDTATATGEVTIVALVPGASSSGLGVAAAEIVLIDPLDWVDSVVQEAETTGGLDAETDETYLNRLRDELSLMSPRPILPRDFEVISRRHAGVWRAVAVDGYNPSGGTFNNERMVAIALQDSTGAAASAPLKAEVAADLDAKREVNFVINMIDPVYKLIDVTYTVHPKPGVNGTTVVDRVDAALAEYFDPATWGLPEDGDPRVWINTPIIRYLEVATFINNVDGVDYIGNLFIGIHGTTLDDVDVTMTGGVVLLPTPNLFSGVAV